MCGTKFDSSLCVGKTARSIAVFLSGLLALTQGTAAFGPPTNRLTLEISSVCQGDANDMGPGDLITVELRMRDVNQTVTGFQAFIEFDDLLLDYREDLSDYTPAPFSEHFEPAATAEVFPGQLNLDGSDVFGGSGTSADALLADLVFEVLPGADCEVTAATFRLNPPFLSELSFEGAPIATSLEDSPDFTLDNTPPMVFSSAIDPCYPDTGSAEAAALAETSATDHCTTSESIVFSAETSGDPCSANVVVTAADSCGNTATALYFTRIDDTDPVLTPCPADIIAVAAPEDCSATVHFTAPTATDDCDGPVPVVCVPPSGSEFPAGDTVVTCTATDSCGHSATCSFTVTVNAIRNRLMLEMASSQQCYLEGEIVCVELWMRCLDQPVTGFNAFLGFNSDVLQFQPAISSYTASPFPLHISDPPSAVIVGPDGVIALDGSVAPMDPGTLDDALLATLCFTVKPGMGGEIIEFDFAPPATPSIDNELSFEGTPLPTDLSTTATAMPQPRLRLVPITPPKCYEPFDLVCVELRMECLGDQEVTGFNAFIGFDDTELYFESGLSSYTVSPFSLHINPISNGLLELDGSVGPLDSPTDDDALLATLCFRVLKTGGEQSTLIYFRPPPNPTFGNELSVFGVPIPTLLEDAVIATANLLKLRLCFQEDGVICVLVEMACLQQPVTGFEAYLEYSDTVLEFQPMASGYSVAPFSMHVNPATPNIFGPVGQFDLDGAVPLMAPGVTTDALLATLCFKVRAGFESVPAELVFRVPPPMSVSALLDDSGPLPTHLRDSAPFNQAGDIDVDGDVDVDDLNLLAGVLVSADTDADRRARCDLNCDDSLNAFDIMTVLDILFP